MAYSCPGEALDAEMEGTLSYIAGDNGTFMGGRFIEKKNVLRNYGFGIG